jgi:hypothetical protein
MTAHASSNVITVVRHNVGTITPSQIPTQGPAVYTYNASKKIPEELLEQRDIYQRILKSLPKSSRHTYKRLMPKLGDYPLKSYLEYAELTTRLHSLPTKEVNNFLAKNDGAAYADRLRVMWLR